MKKIVFKTIRAQNFLSFGKMVELPIEEGISVITGINHDKQGDANGCGKSTIFDAIKFAIYGSTLKDLKKDEIINRAAKKNCVVELDMEIVENGITDTYTISRGISPSFCKLIKNDDDGKETPSTMPETNAFIVKLINTSDTMFCNTEMMSLTNLNPFMKQGKKEKREFVEGIFNLQFLKEMNKICKEESDLVVNELTAIQAKITDKGALVSTYKTKSEMFESGKVEKLRTCRIRIADTQKNIADVKDGIKIVLSDEDVSKYESDIDAIHSKKVLIDTEISEYYKKTRSVLSGKRNSISDKITRFNEETSTRNRAISDINKKLPKDFVDYETYLKSMSVSDVEGIITTKKARSADLQIKCREHASDIERNKASITQMKELGNMCLKCLRPFSETDVEDRDSKIEELSKSNLTMDTDRENMLDEMQILHVGVKQLEDEIKFYNSIKTLVDRIPDVPKGDLSEYSTQIVDIDNTIIAGDVSINVKELEKDKLSKEVQEKTRILSDNDVTVASNDAKLNNIKNLEKAEKTYTEELTRIQEEVNEFENLTISTQQDIAKLVVKADEVKENVDVYKIIKEILSDDGYRAHLIKQLVTVLNERINIYLQKLDAPALIMFDEYFEDSIVDVLSGDICSYDSFSAGEQRRIDLATLLAFMDMRRLQGDVVYNVSFFDEILDSALSETAEEKLMNILRERYVESQESSVLITHKEEILNNPNIDHQIRVEKLGGITTIV